MSHWYLQFNSYPQDANKNENRFLRKKAAKYAINSNKLVKALGNTFLIVIKADQVLDIPKKSMIMLDINVFATRVVLQMRDITGQECTRKYVVIYKNVYRVKRISLA